MNLEISELPSSFAKPKLVRRLQKIDGHKLELLKESGFMSIHRARKIFTEKTDKQIYDILFYQYNSAVDEINSGILEQREKEKKAKEVARQRARAPRKKTKREEIAERVLQDVRLQREEVKRQKQTQKTLRDAYEKKKEEELLLSSGEVKLVTSFVADRIRFFEKQIFVFANVTDLERYYTAVKIAMGLFPQCTSMTVYFRALDSNKTTMRNITSDNMYDFESFSEEVGKLMAGESLGGSDIVSPDEFEIIYSTFALARASLARGEGKKEDSEMFFKTVGIDGKKKDCAYQCLKHLGVDYKGDPEEIASLEKLLFYISDKKLDIIVINNTPILKKENTIGQLLSEEMQFKFIENARGFKKKFLVHALKDDEILVESIGDAVGRDIFLRDGKYKVRGYIVYDSIGEHFDVISTTTPELREGEVFISASQKLICNDKIFDSRSLNKTSNQVDMKGCYNHLYAKEGEEVEEVEDTFGDVRHIELKKEGAKCGVAVEQRFLVFDYETVIDFTASNICKAYSVSILNVNEDELQALNQIEDNEEDTLELNDKELIEWYGTVVQEEIKKIYKSCQATRLEGYRKKFALTFTGYDSDKQMLRYIAKKQRDTAFVLVGFNNSNFDNFILLNSLLSYSEQYEEEFLSSAQNELNPREYIKQEMNVSGIFYNGSQILNMVINGRHETFDIRKHLVGSLSANCKSFKITCCAKKSLDHNEMQMKHENGELISYITSNEEVKIYNEFDVLATAVLFYKYREALKAVPIMTKRAEELHKHKTIGSMIFGVFKEMAEKR